MVELMRGDVFAKTDNSWVSKGVQVVEALLSADGKAEYTHAGIITDSEGTTLEACLRVGHYHLDNYIGQNMIIARPVGVSKVSLDAAILRLEKEEMGNIYPVHRFIMHLLPVVRKFGFTELGVCSEFVAKGEYYAGLRHSQWRGTNPDMLADEWASQDAFEVIFEGVWSK